MSPAGLYPFVSYIPGGTEGSWSPAAHLWTAKISLSIGKIYFPALDRHLYGFFSRVNLRSQRKITTVQQEHAEATCRPLYWNMLERTSFSAPHSSREYTYAASHLSCAPSLKYFLNLQFLNAFPGFLYFSSEPDVPVEYNDLCLLRQTIE